MSEVSYADSTERALQQLPSALIKSKLIQKYDRDKLFETQLDKTTINELINKPKNVKVDLQTDKAFVIVLKDGVESKVYIDDFESDGVEATSDFISDYLPEFTFPVIFYNLVIAQKEAQAVQKSAVIIYSLDLEFRKYFEDLKNIYDFVLRRHRSDRALYKDF